MTKTQLKMLSLNNYHKTSQWNASNGNSIFLTLI